jgi:hypothetical protein
MTEGRSRMPQHTKVTLRKVEDFLDLLERANYHEVEHYGADLFRLLPVLDQFLVKHDRADLARQLRRAFDKLQDGV